MFFSVLHQLQQRSVPPTQADIREEDQDGVEVLDFNDIENEVEDFDSGPDDEVFDHVENQHGSLLLPIFQLFAVIFLDFFCRNVLLFLCVFCAIDFCVN